MKKFNRLICASVLAIVGLAGSCSTAYAAGTSTGVLRKSIETTYSEGNSYIFFDNYTENTREHIFSGSTTTSGGTTTISDGIANVAHLVGPKDFSVYFAPGGAGGSVTVSFFGAFGTETVVASEGTRTFAFLFDKQSYNITAGTSSVYSTTKNPLLVCVGIEVTAGTVSSTVSMTSLKAR